MFTFGVTSILVLWSMLAAPQEPATIDDSFEVTAESLEVLVREVLPPFEKHSGYKFKQAPTVSVGSAKEIQSALTEELKPQLEHLGGDLAAEAHSTALAPFILGKYQFKNHRIIINPAAINRLSIILDVPNLRRRDTLGALLMHEFCHAMDHERLQIMTKPHGAKSQEELIVWGHLIEGHAQFVARGVCKKHGLEEPFKLFTKIIGMMPEQPGVDAATRTILRMHADTLAAQYYDGERFFQKLHKLGGSEAVNRALVTPPASSMELAVPEWYLDPASRAKAPDFDKMLDKFDGGYAEDWQRTRVSLSLQQFLGVFALIEDKERVSRILESIQLNRGRLLSYGLGEKMVTAVLTKHRTALDAQAYLTMFGELSRKKDEVMARGPIRVKSAEYQDVEGESWRGEVVRKLVQSHEQEIKVSVGMVICGNYGVELMYANEPITDKEMLEQLERLVRSLIGSPTKAK